MVNFIWAPPILLLQIIYCNIARPLEDQASRIDSTLFCEDLTIRGNIMQEQALLSRPSILRFFPGWFCLGLQKLMQNVQNKSD